MHLQVWIATDAHCRDSDVDCYMMHDVNCANCIVNMTLMQDIRRVLSVVLHIAASGLSVTWCLVAGRGISCTC